MDIQLVLPLWPRLNCRGNFVEAPGNHGEAVRFGKGLGLTAEATSLRR